MQNLQRFCSHCGAANDKTATFCFACSSPLSQEAEKLEDDTVLLNQRYRMLTSVGIGGFGTIYKVQDIRSTNALFAVKQINLTALSTTQIIEATEAFHREVRMLSSLHHENLPRIYDAFTDPQHWYMVMDFIEGETLEQYLTVKSMSSRSPGTPLIPINEIIAIGIQLCSVLAYLHKRQPPIIFRDLKPANIMRTAQGHLFLIDFGIARQFKPGKVRDTLPLGSPGYAPPEQYGKAQTAPSADIYSFGVLLHQFLSGDDPSEHPFQFAPLRMYGGSDFVELAGLIEHMVYTQAEQRPTIDEVKKVFQRIQDRDHLQDGNVFSVPHSQGKNRRRQPARTTKNSSKSIQQQVPFPQHGIMPGQQQSRRGFIRLGLGAIVVFSAGWLASSWLSHATFPSATVAPAGGRPYTKWILEIGSIVDSPVVANSVVYISFSSWDGSLYAVDAVAGKQKWVFRASGSGYSSPVVADGVVYVGFDNGNLYAVDAVTGKQKWVFLLGISTNVTPSPVVTNVTSSPVVTNGVVYAGSDNGNLYAIDAITGKQEWIFQTSGSVYSPPVVADGVVYVSSDDGNLYAIDATTGLKRWAFAAGSALDSSPAVANGVVYVGSYNRNLYAVDVVTGQKKWAFLTGDTINSSPAVADGVVYVVSYDGNLYAVDAATGQKQWSFATGNNVGSSTSSMVVGSVVYVGSDNGNLYALDATTGRKRWAFQVGGSVKFKPTIANGVLYVGSIGPHGGNFYALVLPSPIS